MPLTVHYSTLTYICKAQDKQAKQIYRKQINLCVPVMSAGKH